MEERVNDEGQALRTLARGIEQRASALGATGHRGSRTQRVYSTLREDILRARLQPGEMIVEPELAARFEVSKTPVREALQILAVEGLVSAIPRRGYVVSQIGLNDVREILDLRLVVEPAMTSAAVRAVGNGDLVPDLRAILDVQRSTQGTVELTDAARAFHERILSSARNNRAGALLSGLFDDTTRVHHLMPAIDENLHSERELIGHERILAAVEAGDAEEAGEAMRLHLAETKQAMLEAFIIG